jgi:hypothetical protein
MSTEMIGSRSVLHSRSHLSHDTCGVLESGPTDNLFHEISARVLVLYSLKFCVFFKRNSEGIGSRSVFFSKS